MPVLSLRGALLGTVLMCGAVPASLAGSIGLELTSGTPRVGETLTIDLKATDLFAGHGPTDALTSFGFDWDLSVPGLLVLVGTPLPTPGLSDPYELATGLADVVALAGATAVANGPGPVDLVLARFSFLALAPGSLSLAVDGRVPDPNGERGLWFLEQTDPTGFQASLPLTIAAAPAPGSALLLALGLGLLRARRRGAAQAS